MKTVFLIGFLPNPRIMKRINLACTYSEVHLICWDRQNNNIALSHGNNYTYDEISIRASSEPLKRLIPYARFRSKAMKSLRKQNPDIIHVQGLDMLQIAVIYQKRYKPNVKIIYEVADLHRLLVDRQHSLPKRLLQMYLINQDKVLCRKIDLLIVTAQLYYDTYFKDFVPENKYMFFPNVPDLKAFAEYRHKAQNDTLTVGYIGGIRYKKQIRNLLDAAEKSGVNVLLAGFESDGNEIESIAENMKNVEWAGRFDFLKSAAELYGKCDLIYSVYDADMANVRVALPNKLYESIHCETPIIVAKGTYLAQLTEDMGVGFAVDHRSPEELAAILCDLKSHPEKINAYSENCRAVQGRFDLEKCNEMLKEKIKSI